MSTSNTAPTIQHPASIEVMLWGAVPQEVNIYSGVVKKILKGLDIGHSAIHATFSINESDEKTKKI
jgi:hypothetical protein